MLPSKLSTERLMTYLKELHDAGEHFVHYRGKTLSEALDLSPMEIDQLVTLLVKEQRLYVFSIPGGRYLRLASEDTFFPTLRHVQIFLILCTQRIEKKNLQPLAKYTRLTIGEVKPFLKDLLERGDIKVVQGHFDLTTAGELKRGKLRRKEVIFTDSFIQTDVQTEEPSTLSSMDINLLNYIQAHQPIPFSYDHLTKKLGVSKPVCRKTLQRLMANQYVSLMPFSKLGNCLVIHLQAPKPYKSFGSDAYLTTQKMALIQYLNQQYPVLYSTKPLAEKLGMKVSEVKRLVSILEEQRLITFKPISGVGTCLIPIQDSIQDFIQASHTASVEVVKPVVPNPSLRGLGYFKELWRGRLFKTKTPTLYLVDTENVSANQLNVGLKQLSKGDQLILMKTQRTSRYEHSLDLNRCLAQVKIFHQEVSGKNALDFVIISEATRQLMKNPHQKLCIVSDDRGFDAALGHLADSLNLSRHQLSRCADLTTIHA